MTAPLVVCRLSESAVAEIVEIELESNTPSWGVREFSHEFSSTFSMVFGARGEGMLLGFVVCRAVLDEAHIMRIGVRRENRARGIGREMMRHLLAELREMAVHWLTLEVRKSNAVARALYESLGFTVVDERAKYYPDNGEDGLVMRLNLDS